MKNFCLPSLAEDVHKQVQGALSFLGGCPCIETQTKFSVYSQGCNLDFLLAPSGTEYVLQNHKIALVLDMQTLKIVELAIEEGSVLFFGTKIWFDTVWHDEQDLHAIMFQQSTTYEPSNRGMNPLTMMDIIEYNRTRV